MFWDKVNMNGPIHSVIGTECWMWIGHINDKGYGIYTIKGVQYYAHRYSYSEFVDVEMEESFYQKNKFWR